jgi:hypothetical protein
MKRIEAMCPTTYVSVRSLTEGLGSAQAKGWTVVNMKDDWKTIFPFTNK